MGGSLNIESSHLSFLNYIYANRKLKIPKYQRNYSWNTEHINELFDDMDKILDRDMEHFIGVIIALTLDSTKKIYEIIDGQQRTATLIIVLAIIRDLYLELDIRTKAQTIQNLLMKHPAPGEQHPTKILDMNKEDESVFTRLVFEYFSKRENEPEETAVTRFLEEKNDFINELADNEPKNKILLAYKLISSYFQKQFSTIESSNTNERISLSEKERYLDKFENTINRKLNLVFLTTDELENTYMIFETLNGRGLELSLADLLKNYLFHLAEQENRVDEITECWDKITKNIFVDRITEFISYYWSSKYDRISSKFLYREVKGLIANGQTAYSFTQDLLNESFNYQLLITPSKSSKFNALNAKEKEFIRVLRVLNVKQVNSVLLSVIASDEQNLENYLRLLTLFAFRFNTICGNNPRDVEKFYSKSAIAIREGNLTFEDFKNKILLSFNPTDEFFESNFTEKQITAIGRAKYILSSINDYLLRRDDAFLEHRSSSDANLLQEIKVNPNREMLTLEHILPKNPEENSSWKDVFSDYEHDQYVNRIGNFTLLSKPLNQEAQNKEFVLKRDDYYSQSKIPTTIKMLELDEWSKDDIETIQEELAEIACEIWKIE